MNHIYPNFFITHEREGFWHELQMGRDIYKCLSGTCPRYCLLAARGDQHSSGQAETPPYCAWLVPLEGEPLGHFQMVEGGVGEIGRVYNPHIIRGHLPGSLAIHPLSRAFHPEKHGILSEFYRRGNKASYHYAKGEPPFETELGTVEREFAMRIYHQHPEWHKLFHELSKDFLWSVEPQLQPVEGGAGTDSPPSCTCHPDEAPTPCARPYAASEYQKVAALPSPRWKDVSNNCGGHNEEYDWQCLSCGNTTWFGRSTDPNKEEIPCFDCPRSNP